MSAISAFCRPTLIPIGFGINAFVRPDHALSFFSFEAPTSPAERDLVHSLMAVYGARDIFMGVALFSALCFGHAKSAGWILMATSAVAFVDGLSHYTASCTTEMTGYLAELPADKSQFMESAAFVVISASKDMTGIPMRSMHEACGCGTAHIFLLGLDGSQAVGILSISPARNAPVSVVGSD
ncbi:hypothetical protein BDV28DRAFT_146145 [Aspergillus coremiiformis]|uniref:Uncharacterized protein n=1 Tax=Aspergillus coremiiformis TaxID=138285 RepID=A0A5N6ZCU7_9EURO|nr:hypothetical protein BDV28DRAFT_146145 [Aspergillus coremiiformis]